MNKEQARLYVKNRLDEYLSAKGINIRKPFRCLNPSHDDENPSMSYDRKRKKAHCFACGADYDTFDLVAIDYNIRDNGRIFKKAYDYFGIELGNKKPEQISGYIARVRKNVSKTDYFRERGLSESVIKRFGLGYDCEYSRGTGGKIWKAAIIPTGENSFTARNTDPYADKGNRFRKQGGSPLFNFDNAINSSGPVFVVEGELDALSIIEAGGNALALGSTANWRQAEFFFKGQVLSSKNAEEQFVKRKKTIIISLDNDDEGRNASEKLLNALGDVFERCVCINVSLGYKDANEALKCAREAFVNKVRETVGLFDSFDEVRGDNCQLDCPSDCLPEWENICDAPEKPLKAPRSDFNSLVDINLSKGKKSLDGAFKCVSEVSVNNSWQAVGFCEGFNEIDNASKDGFIEYRQKCGADFSLKELKAVADNVEGTGISTGFKTLDASLGRGLFPGLYIIGAISSLGKTTFVLQMADNIASEGCDVLIFSLEMSKRELVAKSVSRHTLLKCLSDGTPSVKAKSALDIMCGGGGEIVNTAMDDYAVYAANVYIDENAANVDDVRNAVKRHVYFTGKKPVVFVDYIQILGNGNVRGTDKQHTDRNVTELKKISRDFQIPLIAISSFNRQSYREAVTMEAFKESGAIEYSSDVLMGLQLSGAGKKDFDADKEKLKNPRAVELKVLKNRNGRGGDVVLYSYYPEFNYFKEK